jgi:hypothetical protein
MQHMVGEANVMLGVFRDFGNGIMELGNEVVELGNHPLM